MEKERGKNKTSLKRRIKNYSSILSLPIPGQRGEGKRWLFIAGGVLLLTMAAFLSGIRLGKELQELKHWPGSQIQTKGGKEEGKKQIPYKFEDLADKESSRSAFLAKDKTEEPKEGEPAAKFPPAEKSKPSPAKPKYTLQIAALNNMEEARLMVSQLQNKGYPAYQMTGSGVAKGTLYRVRVGHFYSLQEAREFALKFEKKERVKPLIISLANE